MGHIIWKEELKNVTRETGWKVLKKCNNGRRNIVKSLGPLYPLRITTSGLRCYFLWVVHINISMELTFYFNLWVIRHNLYGWHSERLVFWDDNKNCISWSFNFASETEQQLLVRTYSWVLQRCEFHTRWIKKDFVKIIVIL